MTDDAGGGNDASMVLVVHHAGKSWVMDKAKWDLDWETQSREHIFNPDNRYLYDRTRALTLAHNIQQRIDSKYGVWEKFMKKNNSSKDNTGVKKKSNENVANHKKSVPAKAVA